MKSSYFENGRLVLTLFFETCQLNAARHGADGNKQTSRQENDNNTLGPWAQRASQMITENWAGRLPQQFILSDIGFVCFKKFISF